MKYFNEGVGLMEKQEFQKAIKIFTKGIKANDIAKSVNFYGRAYSYFEMERFEKAKSDIENSLLTEKINKENINSEIYWLKGLIASSEGNKKLEIDSYEKAKSDLEESKKLDNQNPFLYKNYFLFYKEKEDIKNACQSLEEALKKNMSDYGEENDTKELKN